MNEIGERFVAVAETSDLENGRKVVRVEGRQIAIFRTGEGYYAVDNRCPHMGYPLAQGSLKDGVLTCDWHNFKYSLADGACTSSRGEDVRAYDVRVDAGRVLVNLADEPLEAQMGNSGTITPQ